MKLDFTLAAAISGKVAYGNGLMELSLSNSGGIQMNPPTSPMRTAWKSITFTQTGMMQHVTSICAIFVKNCKERGDIVYLIVLLTKYIKHDVTDKLLIFLLIINIGE